ncbi:MAG: dihydrofolate synthase [Odoribacter sp.]|nr:dihydrofolate synthase [Odoribacter sp.]
MTYKETIEYLYAQLPVYHRIGKVAYKADLDNTLALDDYFGHPHLRFRTVHVAGTNGKGSVSHMIASILQEAGYKTGLYTSPHLKDFRERIRINGEMIPEDDVVSFVEKNNNILLSLKASFFEMSVAMAFDYFARSGVEIAVIEVGLGGRLDSTNIIWPLLSVITNIGHDHMDLLGDTLEKVAGEKAGIIKKNVPVIIGEKQDFSKVVFIEKAAVMSSELIFAEDLYGCRLEKLNIVSAIRRFCLTQKNLPDAICGETPLGGDYQSKNIPAVACATDILRRYFNISADNFTEGIRKTVTNTGLQGRWQILGRKPLMVCDTGHNREGLEYILRQINSIGKTRLHIVLGFVNDKDINAILPLFPKDAAYYFTKASVPRALDENILKTEASRFGLTGHSFDNVALAVQAARMSALKSDMIFIGGSTFIVGDLLQIFPGG